MSDTRNDRTEDNSGQTGSGRPPQARICFQLNEQWIETTRHPATLVLDFVRRERRLVGTKEGCKEGDCGACVVLVGSPISGGELCFRPVTSCLLPLADVDGRWVITVEGLDLVEAASPVQQELVDAGASQCGFCTPGIVMSLTAMALEGPAHDGPCHVSAGTDPLDARVDRALSGHLCRCTGYRSLRHAGRRILEAAPPVSPGRMSSVEDLVQAGWLPSGLKDAQSRFLERLNELSGGAEVSGAEESESKLQAGAHDGQLVRLAGGTDLYVQRGDALTRGPVDVLSRRGELRGIRRSSSESELEIGAQVTFEELCESADMRSLVPGLVEHMHWIASLQVRHRATVGGNLVNASPIGDVSVLLLALGARLRLQGPNGERSVPLRDFYRGYKVMDLGPEEIVKSICIDVDTAQKKTDFQKVSKRKCLDIATVNSAGSLKVENGVVVEAGFAVGGVAPVPLYLRDASAWAVGREVDTATVAGIRRRALDAVAPIDDVRGSARYKKSLCGRLVTAHFLTWFPDRFSVPELERAFAGGAA